MWYNVPHLQPEEICAQYSAFLPTVPTTQNCNSLFAMSVCCIQFSSFFFLMQCVHVHSVFRGGKNCCKTFVYGAENERTLAQNAGNLTIAALKLLKPFAFRSLKVKSYAVASNERYI